MVGELTGPGYPAVDTDDAIAGCGGAEAAVPEHRRGVDEQSVLRPPLFDVGVRRHRFQVGVVLLPPDGHQDARVDFGECVQRLPESRRKEATSPATDPKVT